MKQKPKFTVGSVVHVHGTPGTGTISLVEEFVSRFVYHVRYTDANGIVKFKQAQESDVILIDAREVQP